MPTTMLSCMRKEVGVRFADPKKVVFSSQIIIFLCISPRQERGVAKGSFLFKAPDPEGSYNSFISTFFL